MHLNHPNIAPLLGFNFADEIAIISPWFGNGNIADYLTVHPEADKVELVSYFEPNTHYHSNCSLRFKELPLECVTCTRQLQSLYMETLSRSVYSLTVEELVLTLIHRIMS